MQKQFMLGSMTHCGLMSMTLKPPVIMAILLQSSSIAVAENATADVPVKFSFRTFDVPESTHTIPSSVSENGKVVGTFDSGGRLPMPGTPRYGFIYTISNNASTLITLNVPGSLTSEPASINDAGDVIGSYTVGCFPYCETHGFLYRDGTFTNLDFPGAQSTTPKSINARGEVIGSYGMGSFEGAMSHGFLYADGKFTTLDVPGAQSTSAVDINAVGQVVGYYTSGASEEETQTHGFLYMEGNFLALDVPGSQETRAESINKRGDVVGTYIEGDSSMSHGFLYSDGQFTTLDVTGAETTFPRSINDSGEVAGHYDDASGSHGFVYGGGTFTTLDSPCEFLAATGGQAITNSGQVTGFWSGCYPYTHGFIATPRVAVLDSFSRSNGNLGPNWKGSVHLTDYKVVNHRMRVRHGGPIYWQPNPFGVEQEVFVTLTRFDPTGIEQGLLLKVQGETGNYRRGAIAVKYDASQQVVRVATWRRLNASWRTYRSIHLTLVNGDKLGARVLADGKVTIYRNDDFVGRVTLAVADRKFFNSKTGRVGLWFESAPKAILDDFGGGTHMPQDSTVD